MNRKAVLVVDDEADIRELLVLTLSRMGVDADTASSFEEAREALKARPYDLALTDMRLPDGDGLMVLRHIAEHYGNTPVAVITAFGSTENAVAALKAGAFDYLAKPIKIEQLRPLVTSALKLPRPTQARRASTGETPPAGVPRLLGESSPMQRVREMISKLARSQAPVYIGGESGLVPLDECSVVTAPYEANGQVIGTLGVIGPTRMAYERVIPIVDVTAKLLSNAMSQQMTEE